MHHRSNWKLSQDPDEDMEVAREAVDYARDTIRQLRGQDRSMVTQVRMASICCTLLSCTGGAPAAVAMHQRCCHGRGFWLCKAGHNAPALVNALVVGQLTYGLNAWATESLALNTVRKVHQSELQPRLCAIPSGCSGRSPEYQGQACM